MKNQQPDGPIIYVTRPLVSTIHQPKEGYELAHCELCNTEVWKRPIEKEIKGEYPYPGYRRVYVCTKCALENA